MEESGQKVMKEEGKTKLTKLKEEDYRGKEEVKIGKNESKKCEVREGDTGKKLIEWKEKEKKRLDKMKRSHRKTDVGRRDTKQLQDFQPNAYNPIAIT